MSIHEEVNAAIYQAIEVLGSAIALSPTTLALSVQRKFSEDHIEPHVQYTSLEHLKQMARKVLARRYEPDGEDNAAHQGELFSGQLQDRYPIPLKRGDDPVYKSRDQLSPTEVAWNIDQLRKSAAARLRHADALQAWADNRNLEPA